MELCCDGHNEVCHDELHCPVCSAIEDKDDEITDLMTQISNLEKELAELQEELEDSKE